MQNQIFATFRELEITRFFQNGKKHFRSNPTYVLYPAYCSYQQTDKENGYQGKYISLFFGARGIRKEVLYIIYIIDRKIYTDWHSSERYKDELFTV